MGVLFAGKVRVRPGTYSQIDANNLTPVTFGATNTLALVGQALGGQPGVVQWFNDPGQAARVLRGGDALNASLFAWEPSDSDAGADLIAVVRVNPATKASLYLLDGTGNKVIYLESLDWGVLNDNIQVSVANGSTSGKAVTITYYPNDVTETEDNLGDVLSLQYTGNGTAATLTTTQSIFAPVAPVLATSTTGGTIAAATEVYVKVTALNASGETQGSAEASILVGAGNTNEVTGTIAAVAGATKYNVYAGTATGAEYFSQQVTGLAFTITTVPVSGAQPPATNGTSQALSTTVTGATDGSVGLDICLDATKDTRYTTASQLVNFLTNQVGYTATLIGDSTLATNLLDSVSGQNITASAYTVTAVLGAIEFWISNNSTLVSASVVAGATNAPANIGATNLAGGSEGTPLTTDWQNALTALNAVNVQVTVPLTSSAPIHAIFNANNVAQTNEGMGSILGVYGGALGETVAQTVARAQGLGSDRAILVAPGITRADYTGTVTTFAPYMAAAEVAGRLVGLSTVSTPLTFKDIKCSGLEQTYANSDLDTLVNAGVTVVVPNRQGGYRVLHGSTTYQGTANLLESEPSIRRAVDYFSDNLRANLEVFIGMPATTSTIASIIASVTAYARDAVKNQIIASWKAPNVYVDSGNPTAYHVDIQVQVIEPLNYELVTISLAA